jgi:hypothetical protein
MPLKPRAPLNDIPTGSARAMFLGIPSGLLEV